MRSLIFLVFFSFLFGCTNNPSITGLTTSFNEGWKFSLSDNANAKDTAMNDEDWRTVDLPHDWSIEGEFKEAHPAGAGGGALPGGIGWYRKTFSIPRSQRDHQIYIEFDGVYCNSEVWINGQLLGRRPNGFISFRFDISRFVKLEPATNLIAVKVDNSHQPNARWYTGSGIYRNVRMVIADPISVAPWGTYITTPQASEKAATVVVQTRIINAIQTKVITLETTLYNSQDRMVGKQVVQQNVPSGSMITFDQTFVVENPDLWSPEIANLYRARSTVSYDKNIADVYETTFGIRTFLFDPLSGFSMNGKPMLIKGVCLHHDLGCLGSAVNMRAIERQLEIMKEMGVNAIRTSHNPPAPELLSLCDKMGLMVMDEAFDVWKKEKNPYDYHLDWDNWHKTDLIDQVMRDRNHPSIILWSIGNEVGEQWDAKDNSGDRITAELAGIIKKLDPTRPITAACNNIKPSNPVIRSGALDVIGYNYNHEAYANFTKDYPNHKLIATETTSSLATRGHYDMPSDSVRIWPFAWDKPFKEGNPDQTVSAYDHVRVPWGSTQEETLKLLKPQSFLSGLFIWTGFDYLGEPTPYGWPSRSSYFGVVDLAGFPKDTYYLYQSVWTDQPVLHVFPHWNWRPGQTVDVWAYYNQADEVELFLNGKSQGIRHKGPDEFHVMWRLTFEPGTIEVISRREGKEVRAKEIKTAGKAARIVLTPDRSSLAANGNDLSFITVSVVDAEGNLVPDADNLIKFEVIGSADIAGVDNGDPVSHDSFKAHQRKAFNGMCLLVVKSGLAPGAVVIKATGDGLPEATTSLVLN